MKQNGNYSLEGYESKERNRAIYFLSCAIVVIVLAACIATVITAIYFSDNSPWRDDDDDTESRECNNDVTSHLVTNGGINNQSMASKEGDVVTTKTELGAIEGKLINSPLGLLVEQYLGIPFAEPPVGGNRFKDPRPFTRPYTGRVLKALEFGDACTQLPSNYPEIWSLSSGVSEDCLYLNIWVPYPQRKKSAVMVWFHGGSFNSGSASLPAYDGKVLSSYGDVLFVSINYRLGVLGFIPLDIPGQSPGNQGLKDQQMALKWVQDNIEQFGGDPQQVTIFGESAGAASVGLHLIAPSSKNLFNRAILQSGTPIAAWSALSLQNVNYYVNLLSDRFNCFEKPSLIDCLRDVPAEDLNLMANVLPPRNIIENLYWLPVVDGEFIPDDPTILLESGRVSQKDVMLGVNKDEGTMFVDLREDHNATWWEIATTVGPYAHAQQPEAIPYAYRAENESNYDDLFQSAAEIGGDFAFVCPANKFSRDYTLQGSKVYYYYLTYRPSNNLWPENFGVPHGDDLQWMFGHPLWKESTYTKEEQLLSESIMSMWMNFAKYGNPVPYGEFNWKTFSVKTPSHMEIEGPYDFNYHYNATLKGDKCELWF